MKKIKTTNDHYIFVDNNDFDFLNKFKWSGKKSNKNKIYPTARLSLPHLLFDVPIGKVITYIDGNEMNNQRNNLKVCSKSLSKIHEGKSSSNTSGYKGIHYAKDKKRFVARIGLNNKRIHIGQFKSAKEAAISYNRKALELFGEYAYQNKII